MRCRLRGGGVEEEILNSLLAQIPEYRLFGRGGGGVICIKQWISCSLKHDTIPTVNNLYCFYVKTPKKDCIMVLCKLCICIQEVLL